MDLQRAPQQRGALAHPKDAKAGAPGLFLLRDAVWIEADAIVTDSQPDVAIQAA